MCVHKPVLPLPGTKKNMRQVYNYIIDVCSLSCLTFTGYKGEGEPGICVIDVCSLTCLTVTRYKGERETGMSVIDVGLFTGYKPITKDLQSVS